MTIRRFMEMPEQETRLPEGVVLKPAVELRDLVANLEEDHEEAEALIAVIRGLRREGV